MMKMLATDKLLLREALASIHTAVVIELCLNYARIMLNAY